MKANVSQLSEMTGFDRQTVSRRLIDVEPEIKAQSKVYETKEVLRILYGVMDSGEVRLDPTQEKALLDRERRLTVELERKRREGELYEKEDVKQAWLGMIQVAKSRLMAVRVRLSHEVVGLTNRIEVDKKIGLAHNEVLEQLADDDRERYEAAA